MDQGPMSLTNEGLHHADNRERIGWKIWLYEEGNCKDTCYFWTLTHTEHVKPLTGFSS